MGVGRLAPLPPPQLLLLQLLSHPRPRRSPHHQPAPSWHHLLLLLHLPPPPAPWPSSFSVSFSLHPPPAAELAVCLPVPLLLLLCHLQLCASSLSCCSAAAPAAARVLLGVEPPHRPLPAPLLLLPLLPPWALRLCSSWPFFHPCPSAAARLVVHACQPQLLLPGELLWPPRRQPWPWALAAACLPALLCLLLRLQGLQKRAVHPAPCFSSASCGGEVPPRPAHRRPRHLLPAAGLAACLPLPLMLLLHLLLPPPRHPAASFSSSFHPPCPPAPVQPQPVSPQRPQRQARPGLPAPAAAQQQVLLLCHLQLCASSLSCSSDAAPAAARVLLGVEPPHGLLPAPLLLLCLLLPPPPWALGGCASLPFSYPLPAAAAAARLVVHACQPHLLLQPGALHWLAHRWPWP